MEKKTEKRVATVNRKTKETEIALSLDLDGEGTADIATGIGFFDHMLTGFAKHGFFNLKLQCKGDLYVDGHHTVEDCGIVLGYAIKEALRDKAGIKRYGFFTLPMDDALVTCAVDLCGRPYLNYGLKFDVPSIGYLQTELIKEFFYAVSYSAGMNIHFVQLAGENSHHIAEAAFKAFAKALDEAVQYDPRVRGQLSSKGVLA